jgi:hypothetical protein
MNLTDFFALVLPTSGHIIIAEQLEKGYKHHITDVLDTAVTTAVDLNFSHRNVFFALAGFKAEKVWNPTIKNPDGSLGRWQSRTQANAGWLRSLFLDLDIDPTATAPEKTSKVYATREEALTALDDAVLKLGLPAPMVLDSGGGWHAYWPFTDDVTKDEWQPVAEKFKALCLSLGMKIDPAVPADAARVLRPLGCHNLKRAYARPVALHRAGEGPADFTFIQGQLDNYEQLHGAVALPKKYTPPPVAAGGYSNIGQDADPIDIGHVFFGCGVLGGQMATGGKFTTEPVWRASLGVTKFANTPREAMLAISANHPNFTEAEMMAKADGWNARATTCTYFKVKLECPECQTCPHQITSPANLGKMKVEAPPPVALVTDPETGVQEEIELIQPPAPYIRHFDSAKGMRVVSIASEDADGNPDFKMVAPGDFYPVRILRNSANGEISERTLWSFEVPRLPAFTTEIKQSMLCDTKGLHALLNNLGVYAHGGQIKDIQYYMSAYLNHLARERDRERIYTRLGWQFDNNEETPSRVSFTLGARQVNMDGTIVPCNLSQSVKTMTKNGMHYKGSLAEWSRLMNTHYAGEIYRAHRFFVYCSLASPLLHMTHEKGALVTASGKSGRGKTTALRAGSSVWGHPDALILNGNPQGATGNAAEYHLSTLHSLPMMWDDTTNLGSQVVTAFALNVSQGVGKQRMKGSEHDGKLLTWETMVLSTTNYDDMSQALAGQNNIDASLMRIISVPFDEFRDTTEGAMAAEQFKRGIFENYGHAGAAFMQYVTANYADVSTRVKQAEDDAWMAFKGRGAERFWMKIVGAARVASQIANDLGLLDFPIDDDYVWMGTHIDGMRELHGSYTIGPVEALSSFLEARIAETLVLSSRTTSNLDNVAHMPQRELNIRHEMDSGLIYIAKTAVGKYCAEHNENIRHWEDQLFAEGVLLDKSKQKTLGAETKHAKGQVRCWVVDATKLGAAFMGAVQRITGTVTPLPGLMTKVS